MALTKAGERIGPRLDRALLFRLKGFIQSPGASGAAALVFGVRHRSP